MKNPPKEIEYTYTWTKYKGFTINGYIKTEDERSNNTK